MSLAAKVAKNTVIQIIAKILSTILGIIALGLMTRSLGQEGFGEYTTVFNFMSLFAIVADLGLTLVTVQMISNPNNHEQHLLNNLISLRLISALVFLGVGPLSAIFIPYSPLIKLGILYGSLSFLFIALNQILTGLFQKNLAMEKSAIAEISGRLALIGGLGLSAVYGWGLLGAIWATVAGSALNFLVQWQFSKHFFRLRLGFDWPLWLQILKKSWPLAIIIVFNLIYLKTDTLILSLLKPAGDVGLYGAVYKIIEVLTTLPFMFAGIILPILTKAWHGQDYPRFWAVLQKALDFMIITAIPFVVGAEFLASDLMALVAGPSFVLAGPILQILILAAGLIFVSCLLSHALIAAERQKKLIGAYIFVSLSSLAGYLIFIPPFSYFGAAWTTIYSELAIALLTAFYLKKELGARPGFKALRPALKASIPMALMLWLLPASWHQSFAGLIITVTLAALVYVLGLYLTKGISARDIRMMLGGKTLNN